MHGTTGKEEKTMITIEIEFTTKTVLGLSEAKVDKSVYGAYDDHVDEIVKWVKKAITNDNVRRPMITFGYWDDRKGHEVSTSIIIYDYCQKQELVQWDDRGNITNHMKDIKPDARLIRKLYNESVVRLENAEKGAIA